MKRKKVAAIFVLSSLISLSSCGGSSSLIRKEIELSINPDCPSIIECGSVTKMEATILNTKNTGLIWSTDDDLVATIDEAGNLSAVSKGHVNVTVASKEDPDITASMNVEVKTNTLIKVAITDAPTTLKVGDEITLHASIENDSTNSGIDWQVNNEALATIDSKGNLKIKQLGLEKQIIVTAFSKINPNAYSDKVINLSVSKNNETSVGEIETVNGYSLIFEDSFSTSRLNKSNWEVMTGTGTNYGVAEGWGNGEAQYYLEDNNKCVNGNLVISAKNEEERSNAIRNKTFTSGRIRSKNKVAYTYGRIEASISCPFGNGLWPAFWMLPDGDDYGSWPNSGEIDIMEAKGRFKYSVDGTIHYATPSGEHVYSYDSYTMPSGQDIRGFHKYAVEWDEGEMRFYCDDNLFHTCNAEQNKWTIKDPDSFPAPFNKDFHMLINLAVGGNYDGNRMPDLDDLPARLKVDYVKWYK